MLKNRMTTHGSRLTVLVCLITLLCSFSAAARDVKIRRIRIQIGDAVWNWEDRAARPEPVPGLSMGDAEPQESGRPVDGTKPEAIVSFLDFAPGDVLSEETLSARCRTAAGRLERSGWFGASSVAVLPARLDPGERSVRVKVSEGFRLRFSGGPLFATVGKVNEGGERKRWTATLGYNRAGFSFADHGTGIDPFLYGLSAQYANSCPGILNGDPAYHRGTIEANAGRYIGPDATLTAFAKLTGAVLSSNALELETERWGGRSRIDLVPGLALSVSGTGFPGPFTVGWTSRCSGYGVIPLAGSFASNPIPAVDGSASVSFGFSGHTLAFQLSAGHAWGPMPYFFAFDLSNAPDRSLRCALPADRLSVSSFALANAEYRYRLPSFPIPPVFSAAVEGFVFTDIAVLPSDRNGGSPAAQEPAVAFGGGLRLHFESPVFTSFTVGYGTDAEGRGKIIFLVSGGF